MSAVLLSSVVTPSSMVFASEFNEQYLLNVDTKEQPVSSISENIILNNTFNFSDELEITLIDEFGNEHVYNPLLKFESSVIFIGIKMKYTSRSDGKELISVLNESYGMGTVGDAVAILSGAFGGFPGAIVGGFVGLGFKGFRSRCKEAIAEINAHSSKGAVYMYLDRVEWKAL